MKIDYLEITDCVMTAPSGDSEIFLRIRPVLESQIHTEFLVSVNTLVLEKENMLIMFNL